MFQIFVLLNFCKVSRRTGEASIEENEIFTRVKGKLSQVINSSIVMQFYTRLTLNILQVSIYLLIFNNISLTLIYINITILIFI